MNRFGHLCIIAVTAAVGVVCGCKEEPQIEVYDAPKEPPPGRQVAADGPMASPDVQWDVPAGWQVAPSRSDSRIATFLVGDEQAPVEVAVTQWESDLGGVLANLNRWRRQVDLPPLADAREAEKLSIFEAGELHGLVYDVTGPGTPDGEAKRIIAAMFVGHERTWFVKAFDAESRVEAIAPQLLAFIQTFRLAPHSHGEHEHATQREHADGNDQTAGDKPAITWTKPGTWHREPDPGMFALAAFNVVDDFGASRVTVTQLAGDAGGALPNINRWRGQVNLPPVESLDQQDRAQIEVGDATGAFMDLYNPDAEGNPPRILVVLLPRGEHTWFLKMTGTRRVVDAHRESFLAFIKSIAFEEAAP